MPKTESSDSEKLNFLLRYHKNLSMQFAGSLISTGPIDGRLKEQLDIVETEIEDLLGIDDEEQL